MTQVQLAQLTGCSRSQIANIEQGAVPRHSRVLIAAHAVLSNLSENDANPAPIPGPVEESAEQGRDGAE